MILSMVAQLDLTTLTQSADHDLLRRVPHDLAAYYQALPIAREEGRVTVVTPHPDNHAAIAVLARLLGAEVTPVSAGETAVAAAINQLYPTQLPHRQVLSWTTGDQAAGPSMAGAYPWRARVQATATLFATVLGLSVNHLASDTCAPVLLAHPADSSGTLLVCHIARPEQLADLMEQTSASLLLVRGEPRRPRRILVALRGYASDTAALRQARSLLDRHETAVTVLPLSQGSGWQPDRLLMTGTAARRHLDGCLHSLGPMAAIRLRSGDPSEQLIAELSDNTYDLLVIAAEAWGEFVLHTLERVQAAGVLPDQPILIIRPPVTAETFPERK